MDLSLYVLETERLILRPFRMSDLDDFYEYCSVEGVGENAGWKHHSSREESRIVLEDFLRNRCDFALTDRESGKVIGSLGLMDRPLSGFERYRQCELGYVLAKPYWGKGLMTEACKRVIRFCFEQLNLEMIWISHFDFNRCSGRVIEKCGFRYIGQYPGVDSEGKSAVLFRYVLFNPRYFYQRA